MKKKTLSIILIVIAIIVVTGGAVGYYLWNKPHEKVEDREGVVLTVDKISKAFSTDQDAANAKYLDQAIQVSGTISETEENQDGGLLVILHGEDPELTVQCSFREKDQNVNTGEQVTVKGFCTGQTIFGDVALRDAIIINN